MMTNEKLRALRDVNGFSQQYVAQKLGIDTANYGRIERGKAKLTVDRLEQIFEILSINHHQFFCCNSNHISSTKNTEELIENLLKQIEELKFLLKNHHNRL